MHWASPMGLLVEKFMLSVERGGTEPREKVRPCLIGRKFFVFLFELFESKENTFSYENQTKTKFENKENEFTIFNILYMNQKTVLCYFPCF